MNERRLRTLLTRLRHRAVEVDAVMADLRHLPFEDLGDARPDHHRALRRGIPEVIFGQSKTPQQVVRIARRMRAAGGPVIATRLSEAALAAVAQALPDAAVHPAARLAILDPVRRHRATGILIVCAGTTDLPVAEEAALVLEALGHQVDRLVDVGIAGLHRLLRHQTQLRAAQVIIAVAGMEGALPSVVAGLVASPVIGVPTSVGYGASYGGTAALLAMLSSCAGGLLVVNIDNGVGAALAAHQIVNLRSHRPRRSSARPLRNP
jgi:pyridinium-3,5-biscarboxylic acid mononucleotide synthase